MHTLPFSIVWIRLRYIACLLMYGKHCRNAVLLLLQAHQQRALHLLLFHRQYQQTLHRHWFSY